MTPSAADILTWTIAGAATAAVIARPFRWPEAVWAVAGAALIVILGLLPPADGLAAVARGADVYLFLFGMMVLSEVARREGVFDLAAAIAVNLAGGSTSRLFALIFAVGVGVTIFLSNDATAVVLTPAVFAVARRARADPLPLLFTCAFVANAASFVLPISNPANLVLYGARPPALVAWLGDFALPSAAAIALTFLTLRWVERRRLAGPCVAAVPRPDLTAGGWTALMGIGATALVLLIVSSLGGPLGAPTAILGALTAAAVCLRRREGPWPLLAGVSWSVIPLVAGLFVLVEALGHTGLIALLANAMRHGVAASPRLAAPAAGVLVAVASNLINNLPAGLIAASTLAAAHPPHAMAASLMIGVDLGPNLSVTGSLATLLWLAAIRREGQTIGFWRFLGVGLIVAPPALAASLFLAPH